MMMMTRMMLKKMMKRIKSKKMMKRVKLKKLVTRMKLIIKRKIKFKITFLVK